MTVHNILDPYDIIKANKRIGKLEILDLDYYEPKSRKYFYKCRCHCDDELGVYKDIIVRRDHLFDRENPSCGCAQFDYMKTDFLYNPNTDSPKFGKLKVLKYLRRDRDPETGKPDTVYLCECKCNDHETNQIEVTRGQLQRGKRSCGCNYNDLTNIPKGFVNTYHCIHDRCKNSFNARYNEYGGRGIKVCQRWHLFRNFKEDMLPGYLEFINDPKNINEIPSLERLDVDGDYEPNNCKWIPMSSQCWNKQNTNYYRLASEKKFHNLKYFIDNYGDPELDKKSVYQKLNDTKKYCKDHVIYNMDAFINEQYREKQKSKGLSYPIKFVADTTDYTKLDSDSLDKGCYNSWHSMKVRCTNPNQNRHEYYIDKGITYDSAWEDYSNFKNDMYESYCMHAKRYGINNTTLDRIDPDKSYCKDNCRWATYKEQANNTTKNRKFILGDNKYTIPELIDQLADPGLSYRVIYNRLCNSSKYAINDTIIDTNFLINSDYRNRMCQKGLSCPIKIIADNSIYKNIELPKDFTFKSKNEL